jgi:hypothetical protein
MRPSCQVPVAHACNPSYTGVLRWTTVQRYTEQSLPLTGYVTFGNCPQVETVAHTPGEVVGKTDSNGDTGSHHQNEFWS